jgi:tetratricopeptide (TPR) repeat protein
MSTTEDMRKHPTHNAGKSIQMLLNIASVFLLLVALLWWVACETSTSPNQASPSRKTTDNAQTTLRMSIGEKDEMIDQALILISKNKPQKAIKILDEVLQDDGDYVPAILVKGKAHNQMRNSKPAIETLARALELEPGNAEAKYQTGLAYFYDRDFKKALDTLEEASKTKPDKPAYKFLQARVCQIIEDPTKALELMVQADQLRPNAIMIVDLKAELHHELEDYESALAGWNHLLELQPGNLKAAGMKGICLATLGHKEESYPWLVQGLVPDDEDPEALEESAKQLMQQGKEKQARALLQKVEELRVFIKHRDQLIEMIKKDPGNSRNYYNLGKLVMVRKKLMSAIPLYLRAVAVDPEYAPPYLELARLFQMIISNDRSFVYYGRYLEIQPSDLKVRLELANYYQSFFELEKALAILRGYPDGSRPDIKYMATLRSLKRELGED